MIALISIKAVTAYLPPEQYGALAILITVQMLCGLFLINPVGQHINLHTHAWWDDKTLIPRLRSFRLFVMISACIGSAVSLVAVNSQAPHDALMTMFAIFAMVMAATWNATLVPMLNMLGFRNQSVCWSIVSSSTSLLSSILLVTIWPSARSWFIGQALGLMVGAIGARFQLMRKTASAKEEINLTPSLLTKKEILTYCLPLSLAAGLMWIQVSGYRIAIEHFWGLEKLGYLAIGLQISGQIWALAESLAIQFLYPFFFRRVSERSSSAEIELAVSDLLNTLGPIYVLLAGLTIITAPYVVTLLVSAEYAYAWKFVALGAVIELCRALGNVLSNAAHVRRRTISLAGPYAAGSSVIIVIIIFTGMQQIDIVWAGIALVIGALTMLIVMTWTMHQLVQFTIDKPRIILAFIIMISLSALATYAPATNSLIMAFIYSAAISLILFAILMTMLWKNPATTRLLSVQLRKI